MRRIAPKSVRYVDTPRAVATAITELKGLDRVGIDTEFHAERRYLPELMLVQVADDERRVWIFDPLRVDLRPLAPVLGRMDWVAHGARNDIALLQEVLGATPKQLWDTQILAGMIGWRFPARLADLSIELLGGTPDKRVSLTDWAARPLDAAQLRYAAEDAIVALRLFDALQKRCPGPEHLSWARQAGGELVEHALAPFNPVERWLGLRVVSDLDEAGLRVLHDLYLWREDHARGKDQPPHYALSDGIALDLARRKPLELSALAENRRIPGGLIRRYGRTLVALVRAALDDPEPPPRVPTRQERRLAAALQIWASALEGESRISGALLMPEVWALLVAMHGPAILEGWRQAAAGEALAAFMEGETAIMSSGGRLALRAVGGC